MRPLALAATFLILAVAPDTLRAARPYASMSMRSSEALTGCTSDAPGIHAREPSRHDLLISASTDRAAYTLGEGVVLSLGVANISETVVSLKLSGPLADFVIRSASTGADVWRFSAGGVFPGILNSCTILPGETLTFSEHWDQRRPPTGPLLGMQVPAGEYIVIGTVGHTAVSGLRSDPAAFIIGQAIEGGLPDQTSTPAGPVEHLALSAGCNHVTLTSPDGTNVRAVAAAITPESELVAIWRYNAATRSFEVFSPHFPRTSDLTMVNRLDAVFICMREPGSLAHPVV